MNYDYTLHPDGYLLNPAPFGDGYFWSHKLPLLGAGAMSQVSRYATVAERDAGDIKQVKTFDLSRCWKQSDTELRPYAVKHSRVGDEIGADSIRAEVFTIDTLCGLSGVLQGEGVVYETDEQVFAIMDLIEGPTLRSIEERTQLPYDALWMQSFASQLCKGLQGMHERQVAWLDGKPENVLCTGHGHSSSLRITICDFGVSHHFDKDPEVCINEVGAAGTPDYLAPEMVIAAQLLLGCEDVHELDGIMRNLTAADAWAAGAIIFSAATGDRLAQEGPRSWDYTEDDFHVARLAYLQQVHMEWKESGMEDIWERLLQATDNDKALLEFLQQLLTLDPHQRANFADLAHHPYLHQIDLPASDTISLSVHDTVALPTVPASQQMVSTPTISKHVSMPSVSKDVLGRLLPVPGMPSLVWDPSCEAVCHMSSGSVYRAWSCTEGSAGDGQQCLIKHQLVDPCQAPPGQGEPLLTFCDSCVIAEAEETASTRVDAINDSVDALVKFQGKLGMPDVQYAYADGHHFTVYQVHGTSVMTLKEYLQHRAEGAAVPPLDFINLAVKLLRMLRGLHATGHFLGALRPERIVVQPDLYLLDFAPGDWLEDVYGVQSTCPYQQMRQLQQGMSRLDSCKASGDIWSLGILLALVAVGEVPFSGDLQLLQGSDELDQQMGFRASVMRQFADRVKREQLGEQLTACVGPDAAHLVLQLLQQKPRERLSAADALALPCYAKILSQQQSASSQGGDKGPGAGDGMQSTSQGVVDSAVKQTNAGQNASSAMHSNAAEVVSSHVEYAASHASSHADGAQPTEADQEESGQGRAPWWGAPLCSVARAGGSVGGWLHGQMVNHPKLATAVAMTGCAALGCWAWKRQR